jgi:hypothetical protein
VARLVVGKRESNASIVSKEERVVASINKLALAGLTGSLSC